MHLLAHSAHEIRVVEKCSLGAILCTKLDEVGQNSQDGSLPLGPHMEGGGEEAIHSKYSWH
jgi:hypothetical protein